MSKNQQKALRISEMIGGLAIGLQILLKAVDKAAYFSKSPVKVLLLFSFALFVILGSLFHDRFEKRFKNVHGLFHILEGAALVISAILLFEKGQLRMPLVILFLGLLFGATGIVSYVIDEGNREVIGKRLMKGTGVALLLGGILLVGLTFCFDRDPWAFGVGAASAIFGGFLARFSDWLMVKLGNSQH